MTALGANANYLEKDGISLAAYPIADNIVIYKGSLVCLNSSGYAIVGASGAGNLFVGVAAEKVDNTGSGHAAGLFNIRVRSGRRYLLTGSGLSQASVGLPAFLSDSGTFTLTPNAQCIGIVTEYVSSTQAYVYVPDPFAIRANNGYRVVMGQATTVAASDTVVTGLRQVVGALAVLDSDPTDDPEWATASIGDQAGSPTAGSILIKTWKNTGGTDPTPAAATTFSKKVNYIAFGY